MNKKLRKIITFVQEALDVFEEMEYNPRFKEYSLALENLQDQCRKMLAKINHLLLIVEDDKNE